MRPSAAGVYPGMPQRRSERFQDQQHVLRRGAVAHHSDAEDLAGQRTEAAGDLDFRCSSRYCRTLASSTPAGTRGVFKVQSRFAGSFTCISSPMASMPATNAWWLLAVARPAVLQTLFGHHHQAFAQRVEQRGRRGVVILAAAVIGIQQLQVEIPGLHRSGAGLEALEGARRDGHGREPGRAAQALLGATVGDVDAVLVDQHRHAAERRDAIGDDQRSGLVGRLADRLRLVVHAGGGFGLHEGHHVRLLAADELARFLRVERLAPMLGEPDDLGALAACHFADAVGEEAVGQQREFAAGLGEVGHRGFHAGTAGAGYRQVELVRRRVGVAQQRANLAGHLEEERIEVSHDRLAPWPDRRGERPGPGPVRREGAAAPEGEDRMPA